MFGLFRKDKKKVFILGLDGVPCSLLKDFIGNGIMPNLSALVKDGTLMSMEASIPEVSSTSWTTFMTGVNPGKHSIYGFMELKPGSYELYFPNSADITSETLWDILGNKGKKCIILNIPSTYPAKPLNGILTAGFVAIDLKKATYPESAYEYLKSINYRMDVDAQKATRSLELLAEDIDITFKKRREAILHFLKKEEWDLFIGTITETDRLHHFLWTALEDNNHKLHRFFIDFYKQIDGLIGEIATFCNSIPFLIVSDHGFASIKQEVYVNYWLREMGYLNFSKEIPDSFESIGSGTKAFALDPARIYINLKGRYTSGTVDYKDYEEIRLRIKEDLVGLCIDGEKVIKKVFLKEELYKGPYYDSAPDLVALSNTGFDLKGSVNKKTLYGRSIFTGAHTRDNATFFINRSVKEDRINIVDVAPTIIKLMGINYDGFDGRSVI